MIIIKDYCCLWIKKCLIENNLNICKGKKLIYVYRAVITISKCKKFKSHLFLLSNSGLNSNSILNVLCKSKISATHSDFMRSDNGLKKRRKQMGWRISHVNTEFWLVNLSGLNMFNLASIFLFILMLVTRSTG